MESENVVIWKHLIIRAIERIEQPQWLRNLKSNKSGKLTWLERGICVAKFQTKRDLSLELRLAISDVVTNLLPSGLKSTSITSPRALEYSHANFPNRTSQSFTEPFEPPVMNRFPSNGWNLTTFTTWLSENTCSDSPQIKYRYTSDLSLLKISWWKMHEHSQGHTLNPENLREPVLFSRRTKILKNFKSITQGPN